MTSASSGGLQLDPADKGDRRIIARQVKVARQAGRDGLDRAGSTRGRADLEAAYDEGAAEALPPTTTRERPSSAGGGRQSTGPRSTGRPSSGKGGGRGWAALRPTSPARIPTRRQDVGGFLAGLGLYTVGVIYIRYGAAGWKGWLSAKFLNKPMAPSGGKHSEGPKSKHVNKRLV